MTQSTEREFYRAKAELAVSYGQDNPGLRKAVALEAKVWHTQAQLEAAAEMALEGEAQLPEYLEPVMHVLRWLDFKMDLILHNQRQSALESVFPHHTHTVDISGSGLGLAYSPGLRADDTIMICLSLPDQPWRPIYARARVNRVVPPDGDQPGEVAAYFMEINESDRERIIRYTFEMQRSALARNAGKD